jgi:hypothetical protein
VNKYGKYSPFNMKDGLLYKRLNKNRYDNTNDGNYSSYIYKRTSKTYKISNPEPQVLEAREPVGKILKPRKKGDNSFTTIVGLLKDYLEYNNGDDPRDVEVVKVLNNNEDIPMKVLHAVFEYHPEFILKVRGDHPLFIKMAKIALEYKPEMLKYFSDVIKNNSSIWANLCRIVVEINPKLVLHNFKQTQELVDIAIDRQPKPAFYYTHPKFITLDHILKTKTDYFNMHLVIHKSGKTTHKTYNHSDIVKLHKLVKPYFSNSNTWHSQTWTNLPETPLEFGVEIEFRIPNQRDREKTHAKRILIYSILKKVLDIKYCERSESNNIIKDKSIYNFNYDKTTYDMNEVSTSVIKNINRDSLFRLLEVLKILEKEGLILVDNKCGLHVHIDASALCFAEIIEIIHIYRKNETVVKKILAKNRFNNKYCKSPSTKELLDWLKNEEELSTTPDMQLKTNRRYTVNPFSYFYYKTIEFRQHEGTLSPMAVFSWVHVVSQFILNRNKDINTIFLDSFFEALNIDSNVRTHYKNKYLIGG